MWRKMCVRATRHPESLVPVHLGKAFGLARPEEARVRPAVVAHAHAGAGLHHAERSHSGGQHFADDPFKGRSGNVRAGRGAAYLISGC